MPAWLAWRSLPYSYWKFPTSVLVIFHEYHPILHTERPVGNMKLCARFLYFSGKMSVFACSSIQDINWHARTWTSLPCNSLINFPRATILEINFDFVKKDDGIKTRKSSSNMSKHSSFRIIIYFMENTLYRALIIL